MSRERALVLAAVAALALAAAPAASAKAIAKAEVCGADGCSTAAGDDRQVLGHGGASRTPPAAAPFYMVRIEVDTGDGRTERWEMTAVPERRALRAEDGTWVEMPPEVAAVIAKLTAGRRGYPASGLMGAAPPPPEPRPAPAPDADSPLWPEGVLIALALAVGGVFLVVRASARTARRASSRRARAAP